MFIETKQGGATGLRVGPCMDGKGVLITVTDNDYEQQAKAYMTNKRARKLADCIYEILKEQK